MKQANNGGTIFFALCLGAALFFLLPSRALGVTVGPAKMEFRVDPGEAAKGVITLINDSNEAQTLYPDFEKFTEVNGEKKFSPGEYTALTSWFDLPKSVTIEQGGQKKVPFVINVPENAPPGGHFAVIWWSTAPPKGQVSIVTRAGILAYVQVSGEISEKGELRKFNTPNNGFFIGKLPDEFSVDFANLGNTYLKPKGEITIKNIFGSALADYKVNSKEKIIFPENVLSLDVAKKFEKRPFAFGLYQAEINLAWGEDGSGSAQKKIFFFVFPWKTVLIALGIFGALAGAAMFGVKRYNKWIVKQYAQTHAKKEEENEEPVVKTRATTKKNKNGKKTAKQEKNE